MFSFLHHTETVKDKVTRLIIAGAVMALGMLVFKYIPMSIFGNEILFDASLHITVACFILYILWYFIDQNPTWRMPFFIFSALVLSIISFQRITVNAHDDIGLLAGLVVSLVAIAIAEKDYLKGKISF